MSVLRARETSTASVCIASIASFPLPVDMIAPLTMRLSGRQADRQTEGEREAERSERAKGGKSHERGSSLALERPRTRVRV